MLKKYEKIALVILVIVLMAGLSILGFMLGLRHKTIIVHTDFEDLTLTVPIEEARYSFMPREMSDYICALCSELQIDSNLAVSILMRENPEFNPDATHRNENGTLDTGLWQLNDAYLYKVFVPSYWDMPIEFNTFNWKHNTFIACHLIQDLSQSLKIQDEVIMAYNCGYGAVMNGKVPASTFNYLAGVKNNYTLLKGDM